MQEHFSFIHYIFGSLDQVSEKLLTAIFIAVGLVLVAGYVYSKISTASKREKYIVPNRFSLVGLCDYFVEEFVHFQDSILGVENRRFAPFCGSVFLFIFASNFLGLIPGMAAATTTIVVNLSVALVVFIYFNYLGVRENGFYGYLKHFAGPFLALAPLLFGIEMLSTILRVFTLNLRLYWNISVDHIVMGIFMDLCPILGVGTYLLGFFVAMIQALVFTILTMVYIQLAIQHEEA